jgi:hypothetical protein
MLCPSRSLRLRSTRTNGKLSDVIKDSSILVISSTTTGASPNVLGNTPLLGFRRSAVEGCEQDVLRQVDDGFHFYQ